MHAEPDESEFGRLIARHDRPGPRYTSYPTAPVWTPDFRSDDFAAALGRVSGPDLAIYVHVPYCERLCSFCACNRMITQDHGVIGPYLEGLRREADLLAEAIGASVQTVQLALGGGTPNFLAVDELAELSEIVDSRFPRADGAERSIELDPRTARQEQLEKLVELGFNRVSLGVQDTSPRVQRAINRIQPTEMVERLTGAARELGIQSVSFDLIYGLPYQTRESFDATLNDVIELRPDRIALYSYAHVTWISKAQRGFEKKDLPAPEQKLRLFLRALERLGEAGYVNIGLDHFALPEDELARAARSGSLRRNFMGYTVRPGLDLIALGPSGIAELSDCYAQSEHAPDAWRERLAAGELPTTRGIRLSEDDRRRRWLIQHWMCRAEISPAAYHACFDEALEDRLPHLARDLNPYLRDGLLEFTNERWVATPVGRMFLRVIAMVFDAHLESPDPTTPRFSRTV